MKDTHLVALMFAAATGAALFSVLLQIILNVLFPVVELALGIEIRLGRIELGDPGGQDDILYGFVLASIIAAVLAVGIFALVLKSVWTRSLEGAVECPYCLSLVPAEAVKCAYCASDLPEFEEEDGLEPAGSR